MATGALVLSLCTSHINFLSALFNSLSSFTASGFYEGKVIYPESLEGLTVSGLMLAGKPGILLLGWYLVKKYPEHRAELLPL